MKSLAECADTIPRKVLQHPLIQMVHPERKPLLVGRKLL